MVNNFSPLLRLPPIAEPHRRASSAGKLNLRTYQLCSSCRPARVWHLTRSGSLNINTLTLEYLSRHNPGIPFGTLSVPLSHLAVFSAVLGSSLPVGPGTPLPDGGHPLSHYGEFSSFHAFAAGILLGTAIWDVFDALSLLLTVCR